MRNKIFFIGSMYEIMISDLDLLLKQVDFVLLLQELLLLSGNLRRDGTRKC